MPFLTACALQLLRRAGAIGDELGDRHVEFAAQPLELRTLLPALALARVGDYDHLVRAEVPQLILDRRRNVGVADLAPGL